jgi:hypothetical protein
MIDIVDAVWIMKEVLGYPRCILIDHILVDRFQKLKFHGFFFFVLSNIHVAILDGLSQDYEVKPIFSHELHHWEEIIVMEVFTITILRVFLPFF